MRKLQIGINDFQTKFPKIAEQWDYKKNYPVLPSQILPGSHKKYWFICKNGHSFKQTVINRCYGKIGCPYCANQKVLLGYNDLETYIKNHPKYKYLLDEWDYNKNILKPSEIVYGSCKKYWWICKNNHSYQQSLYNRIISKFGCPYCSSHKVYKGYNDFSTWCNNNNRQDILDEWDYEKNNKKPDEVLFGSHTKFWFKCKNNHSYQQDLKHKTERFQGCPYCVHHKSAPELVIYEICKNYIDKDTKSGIKINGYEIDIFVPSKNICTEYDGIFFHNSEESKIRENNKNISILEDPHNYKFIRIKETNNPDNIKKFKEILPSGLIIYYISNKYDKEYFQRLSEIIKDITSISIDYHNLKRIFYNIKSTKLHK